MGPFDSIRKNLEKSAGTLKDSVMNLPKSAEGLVDSVKNLPQSVKEVDVAESMKGLVEKGGQAIDDWKAKADDSARAVSEALGQPEERVGMVTTEDALKIIYYLMAVDGQILPDEKEKFEAIGCDMDPDFGEHKEELLKACEARVQRALDDEDYYDNIHDGAGEALRHSRGSKEAEVHGRLLVWNLLAVVYSDGDCSESERRLIRYITRELAVDKTVLEEMESTVQTLMALGKEGQCLKKTGRPYPEVEAQLKKVDERSQVVLQGVQALIAD